MENPWRQLPRQAPRVLPADLPAIQAFNVRYANQPDFTIQTQLYPEPFIGDPRAPVYVLGLNPGYSDQDDAWHASPRFAKAIRNNLLHQPADYPFYFFDPQLADAPGARWWLRRSRWLIQELGSELLASKLCCVELFPYHSRKYRPLPRSLWASALPPAAAYAVHLVRSAMQQQKPIVAMRAFARWARLIPELPTYPHLHRLNSPQNVSLSPNNLPRFEKLVRAFRKR